MPLFGPPHTFGFGTFGSGHTPQEACERLYRTVLAVLPSWFHASGGDTRAILKGLAAVFGRVEEYIRDLREQLFINQSIAPFLDEHGKDVGRPRSTDETDPSLKLRIRFSEDAVSATAIKAIVQALVDQDVGGPIIFEESRQLDPSTTVPNQAFEYVAQDFFVGQSKPRRRPLAGYFQITVPNGISQATFDAIVAALPTPKAAGYGFVVTEAAP